MNPGEVRSVHLLDLQPSNWYLNQAKLERIREAWASGNQADLPPVLITQINEKLCLIDGHSRAYAAYENNSQRISAIFEYLESIEGCAELYRHVYEEAQRMGLQTIADLAARILSPDDHKRLWIDYNTNWLRENGDL